jgi:hypothetical protein
MFDLPPAGDVLGAMITPALLISASGTLVLSTSNRLGRVVDRVRVLGELAEALPDGDPATPEDGELRGLIADQLAKLTARIGLLQTALSVLYAAIGALVASSLTVGMAVAAGGRLGWVPVGLGLGGATALFAASVMLVLEARLAVRATLHEMDYVRRTVARKTGRPLPFTSRSARPAASAAPRPGTAGGTGGTGRT